MTGDELTIPLGNTRDPAVDVVRGLLELGQVGLGVVPVGLRPVGVGLDEGVTNHLNVGLGVLDAHPQVGVDLTVDVGTEHRLGQLVDGGAGTSQESERR